MGMECWWLRVDWHIFWDMYKWNDDDGMDGWMEFKQMTNNWAIVWSFFFFQTFYENLKLQTMTPFLSFVWIPSIHPSHHHHFIYAHLKDMPIKTQSPTLHSHHHHSVPITITTSYYKSYDIVWYQIISYLIIRYRMISYHTIFIWLW